MWYKITPGNEKTAPEQGKRDRSTAWNYMICIRICCGGTRHAVYKNMGHVIYMGWHMSSSFDMNVQVFIFYFLFFKL